MDAAALNVQRILARFKAAVLMCYPDDMTPGAKRAFESIIEAEIDRMAVGGQYQEEAPK